MGADCREIARTSTSMWPSLECQTRRLSMDVLKLNKKIPDPRSRLRLSWLQPESYQLPQTMRYMTYWSCLSPIIRGRLRWITLVMPERRWHGSNGYWLWFSVWLCCKVEPLHPTMTFNHDGCLEIQNQTNFILGSMHSMILNKCILYSGPTILQFLGTAPSPHATTRER